MECILNRVQNRKGGGWEGRSGSFTPVRVIFCWCFSRVKGLTGDEPEQDPWESIPSENSPTMGQGAHSWMSAWGVNPAHQATWAIHILRAWATLPPCTLGSSHNSNRQEKGTSSPFPGQQPEPLPTQQAMRGNVYQAGAASLSGVTPPVSSQPCRKRTKSNYGPVLETKILQGTKNAGAQLKNSTRRVTSDWVFIQECNTIAKLQFCQSNEHIKSFLSYFQTFIIKPLLNNPITEVCIFSQVIRPTNLERPPALVYLTGHIPASFQPTGICSQIYSWQTTSLNISSSSTELFNVYL